MFRRMKETRERIPNRFLILYIEIEGTDTYITTHPFAESERRYRYWQIEEFLAEMELWKLRRDEYPNIAIEYTHDNFDRIERAKDK